jgi:hypothetical protein
MSVDAPRSKAVPIIGKKTENPAQQQNQTNKQLMSRADEHIEMSDHHKPRMNDWSQMNIAASGLTAPEKALTKQK